MGDHDAHDRGQIVVEQLLHNANQVAYVHQLSRELAIISGRLEPDVEAALVTTEFQPRPPRRKPKGTSR